MLVAVVGAKGGKIMKTGCFTWRSGITRNLHACGASGITRNFTACGANHRSVVYGGGATCWTVKRKVTRRRWYELLGGDSKSCKKKVDGRVGKKKKGKGGGVEGGEYKS